MSEFIVADLNALPAAVNHAPVITSGNSFIRLFNLQIPDKNLGWSSTKGEKKSRKKAFFFSFFGWYVGVLLSVSGDNGIIEVLGVTGALMPGFLERG